MARNPQDARNVERAGSATTCVDGCTCGSCACGGVFVDFIVVL